jgi:hypothetical protein
MGNGAPGLVDPRAYYPLTPAPQRRIFQVCSDAIMDSDFGVAVGMIFTYMSDNMANRTVRLFRVGTSGPVSLQVISASYNWTTVIVGRGYTLFLEPTCRHILKVDNTTLAYTLLDSPVASGVAVRPWAYWAGDRFLLGAVTGDDIIDVGIYEFLPDTNVFEEFSNVIRDVGTATAYLSPQTDPYGTLLLSWGSPSNTRYNGVKI